MLVSRILQAARLTLRSPPITVCACPSTPMFTPSGLALRLPVVCIGGTFGGALVGIEPGGLFENLNVNLVSSNLSFFFGFALTPGSTPPPDRFFSPHKHLQMHRPQISELANESGRPPAYCRQPCLRTATHVLPGHVQKSEKRAGRVWVCGSGDWRK